MTNTINTKLLAYRDVVWTKEIDDVIGTESDSTIGMRYGIAPSSIRARRIRLGRVVPQKSVNNIRWTKAMDRKLGTMPDTVYAKTYNIAVYWVRRRRSELDVAAYVNPETPKTKKTARKKIVLTKGQIASLGKSSDVFLAKRWGVDPTRLTVLRNKLGIAPFQNCDAVDWTKQMLNMLGEVPDGRLAREYGISHNVVKLKRIEQGIFPFGKTEMDPVPEFPDEVIELIGKVPDKRIADQYSVSRNAIRLYRTIHKIELAEYIQPTEHEWTESQLALLGTMSDGNVARKIGIPREQVHHKRRTLGIAAFDRKATVRWTKCQTH